MGALVINLFAIACTRFRLVCVALDCVYRQPPIVLRLAFVSFASDSARDCRQILFFVACLTA